MDDLLTSKQLQNLLRVDRITVYRMLNDGRLRGFKVGGQWRFSRREIEAWLQAQQNGLGRASTLAAEHAAPSAQVLPLTCINAIQAVCAEALDLAFVTTNLDGDPLCGISNSCAFCALVLSTSIGRQRCGESWRGRPDGVLRPCHAGLLCASLPIVVGGQAVALTAACQLTGAPANGAGAAWPQRLPLLAAELGLAEADLGAAVGSVHVLAEGDLPRVSRLLRRVADTFCEIGQERLSLLGRLEKIAEMSKI